MKPPDAHASRSRTPALPLLAAGIFLVFGLCPLRADETVRAAQARLAVLGYYKARVDGSPGSVTSAAIRRFQLAEKLKVTGSLNQQTLDALGVKAPPPCEDSRASTKAEMRSCFDMVLLSNNHTEARKCACVEFSALGQAVQGLPFLD
ncbi:MAG: peptidoglycan-binding domain-containing protein [Spartobacteria bacterium]